MALGTEFAFSEFTSDQGVTYKLSIYDSTSPAGTTEFTCGGDGFVLTYKGEGDERYQPIKASNVEFQMNIPSVSSPLYTIPNSLQNSDQGRFKLKIQRSINGGLVYDDFWHGIIVPDVAEFEDVSFPAFYKFTALDGLSLMKDIDFNRDVYNGAVGDLDELYTFTNIISNMLKFYAGDVVDFFGNLDVFTKELSHWYEDTMPTPAEAISPFQYSGTYPYAFTTIKYGDNGEVLNVKALSAYQVLESILKAWGMRIWQQDGHWWIAHVNMWGDLSTFNLWSRDFSYSGGLLLSETFSESDFQKELGAVGDGHDITKLSGSTYSFIPEIKSVVAEYGNWKNTGIFIPGGTLGTQDPPTFVSNAEMESGLIDLGYFEGGASTSFLLQDAIMGKLSSGGSFVYGDTVSAVYMFKIGSYYWNGYAWTTAVESIFTSQHFPTSGLGSVYYSFFPGEGWGNTNFTMEMPSIPVSGQLYYAVRRLEHNPETNVAGGTDYDIRIWTVPTLEYLVDGELPENRIFGAVNSPSNSNQVLDLGEMLVGDGPTTSIPSWGRIRVSNGTTFLNTIQEAWTAWETGTSARITQVLVTQCVQGQKEFVPLNNYNIILRNKAAFRFGDALDDNTQGGNRMVANGWKLIANRDEISGEFFKSSIDASDIVINNNDENNGVFGSTWLGIEF